MCVCVELRKEQEEGDEPRAETESESEEELSCFAPTVSVCFMSCGDQGSYLNTISRLKGAIFYI